MPTNLISPMLSRIYDTSSNDTSSTEPFRRKGFLSKCHFVESPLRRNTFSSNTFDEIFYAHLIDRHIVSADTVTTYRDCEATDTGEDYRSEAACHFYKGARE